MLFRSVPIVNSENIYDELVSSSSDKFPIAIDVDSYKRNIIIYNDFDVKRSLYEGIHNIKATIVNLSVLDGRYHYETNNNPETVLVKTVYNGYFVIPLNNSTKGPIKITKEFLNHGKFKITSAYTSHMGVWSVNMPNDISAPFGVSVLNMYDLKNALMYARRNINNVSMFGDHCSIKLEISFDGEDFQTVLPLTYPMYYSRMHAEMHNDDPIITKNIPIAYDDLCDDKTRVSLLNFTKRYKQDSVVKDFKFNSDSTSELIYLDENDERFDPAYENNFIVGGTALIGSLSAGLFSSVFKVFYRYQLSKLDFLYDSTRNIFSVESINFSYKEAPTDLAKNVIFEFVNESNIHNAMDSIVTCYGDATIIGRITDMKYDLSIKFKNGHDKIPKLRTINYSTTIFDIFNSLTTFETSITNPIIMV